MKKTNLYTAIALFFIVMNVGCSAKKSIVIKFANTLYTTDLTKKGTHPLSTDKDRDIFYNMSRSELVTHKDISYFQSNGDFYHSDGSTEGTQKYEKFGGTLFHPVIYQDRLCYDERGSSVYCLDISNNHVEKSKLLELDRGKNISKMASGVFGDRLLMLTEDNELWISGEDGKAPSLLIANFPERNILKILVTKKIVYFIYSNSDEVNYFYNTKNIPKKVLYSYINIPKVENNSNFVIADSVIGDGNYLYIMKSDGSIHKIDETTLSLSSINAYLTNNFHRLIKVVDNNILYSTMIEKKIGCDNFRHIYKLYKVNISTGQIEEIANKEQSVQTVGGCYHPKPIPPQPVSNWKSFKVDGDYPNSAYTLREDIAYFELRKYLFKRRKQASNKYIPYLSIYRKKLSSFPPEIVQSFQKIPFEEKKLTGLTTKPLNSPDYKFRVKGFIIKTDNKFWIINEKKDIAWLFDKIDTEAELYQYIKMYRPYNRKIENSYKKTATGYDVKQVQIEYKSEREVTRNGYDEYIAYQLHSTYIYHINSNGEFTKEFVSTKSTNKKRYKNIIGFHGDPMIVDVRSPDEIFSEFIGVVTP